MQLDSWCNYLLNACFHHQVINSKGWGYTCWFPTAPPGFNSLISQGNKQFTQRQALRGPREKCNITDRFTEITKYCSAICYKLRTAILADLKSMDQVCMEKYAVHTER